MNKIFKGTVNGTEYTDRESFNAAVDAVVNSGGNLEISVVLENSIDKVEVEQTINPVNKESKKVFDLNRLNTDNYNGIIPLSLRKEMRAAANRNEIIENIDNYISSCNDQYSDIDARINMHNTSIADYTKQIENEKSSIAKLNSQKNDLNKKEAYYKRLLDIVKTESKPEEEINLNNYEPKKMPLPRPAFFFSNFLRDSGFFD